MTEGMQLTTKNTIFILTYCEGDWFVDNAWNSVDHSNYDFIVLDNGNQEIVKDYCEKNGWEYYASQYNIGSTGGYNWIFRAASMLKLHRAALVQADVEINSIETVDLLFSKNTPDDLVDDNSVLMWPQTGPENWYELSDEQKDHIFWKMAEGCPINLGQIFSFNPDYLIYNNLLNDENYVVTHFDDVDLRERMTLNGLRVCNLAWCLNLSDRWVKSNDGHMTGYIDGLYKIHHISSKKENHQNWLDYNSDYYNEKMAGGTNKLKTNKCHQAALRWAEAGYPPFPVEHELNRWWSLRESK